MRPLLEVGRVYFALGRAGQLDTSTAKYDDDLHKIRSMGQYLC